MSRREDVIAAITAGLKLALANASVRRDYEKSDRLEPGGNVVVGDGSPGEPEVTLSPPSYTYQHRIPISVAAHAGNPVALDLMLGAIGAFCEANRTLGGLAEWLEPVAPDADAADALGVQSTPWAEAAILAVYTTSSPL